MFGGQGREGRKGGGMGKAEEAFEEARRRIAERVTMQCRKNILWKNVKLDCADFFDHYVGKKNRHGVWYGGAH